MTGVPMLALPSGAAVPVLGQGTWRMSDRGSSRDEELATLRRGLDLGLTLIDTAEMYGDGASEELVAEAIAGRRDEVFIVTKVSPSNATSDGVVAACERSLRRLNTDQVDLYLLHWPGREPLAETVAGFGRLLEAGKIAHWGVSNFDVPLLEELVSVDGGSAVAANQMPYNLRRRAIEVEVLPWCAERGVPIMAYTPFGEPMLLDDSTVTRVAKRHDATPAQVALAWVLRQELVLTIPKASCVAHVEENRGALELRLNDQDLAELDAIRQS